MTTSTDRPSQPIVDFAALARTVARAAAVVGAVALLVAVVELARGGGVLAALGWVLAAGIGLTFVVAAITFVHALRGARRAQERGQQLKSDDVGFLPPLPRRDPTGEDSA